MWNPAVDSLCGSGCESPVLFILEVGVQALDTIFELRIPTFLSLEL